MQRLLMKTWGLVRSAVLPYRHVGEPVVVAQRLAVRRLVLDTEMSAARLLALERVHAHQLGELEEVRHAAGLLELLVQLLAGAGNEEVLVELMPEVGNLAQRVLETLARARHAAILPHDAAELTMVRVDRSLALGVEKLLRLLLH